MSDVSVGLRFELDSAQASPDPLVGIKLDQSKCFNRLVPDFTAALFLAFGVPKGIVNIFLKVYASLKRHLSYRGWVSSTPTTAANGVAQGCSLSLLAINVHMAVWAKFMSVIPHVCCRVFIDDAYLWVRLSRIQSLRTALQVTEKWNELIGQKLNPDKSSLWASNAAAKKTARKLFPTIPVVLEFDALGAMIYTAQRDAFHFPENKVIKICNDTKNIAALPVPTATKCQLIAARLSHSVRLLLTSLPFRSLLVRKLKNEIANAIWGRRPHWRARMLIFTFLCNPCFVHPRVARAYVTVCNVWRYLHRHPEAVEKLQGLFVHANHHKHSLLAHFREALLVFHCALLPDLCIGIGSSKFSILDVTPKDLRGMLHALGRQYCYESTNYNSRKDVRKPTGLVDHRLSLAFKMCPPKHINPKEMMRHFDAQLVGCTITNDRRAAAGFIDSAACRFCLQTKESLLNIVKECPAAPSFIASLPDHDLGPNFCGLGIIEHPAAIASSRLQVSDLPVFDPDAFDPAADELTWFTDGSVVLQESFWLTTAAYAIFDCAEHLVVSGPVRHISLAAYTAELFALPVAIILAPACVTIFTDCKTIVDLFSSMTQGGNILVYWSHAPIWRKILQVWQSKTMRCVRPVQVLWMPAHTCDHRVLSSIGVHEQFPSGLSGWHIRANRRADEEAKRLAKASAAFHVDMWQVTFRAAQQRQEALTRLNQIIGSDGIVKQVFQTKEDTLQVDASDECKSRFPGWDWTPKFSLFTWRAQTACPGAAQVRTLCSLEDAEQFLSFLFSLQWRVDATVSVAYMELAHLFIPRKHTLTKFLHKILLERWPRP